MASVEDSKQVMVSAVMFLWLDCNCFVGYSMMYQLLNDMSSYLMVIENVTEKNFPYTSMYRSLFIRQY
jgi:hypothetical protein